MLGSQVPALQLGSDTVSASDHIRVLGVTFSSDLSLEKHVCKTCAASFHWLRQLRRIRKLTELLLLCNRSTSANVYNGKAHITSYSGLSPNSAAASMVHVVRWACPSINGCVHRQSDPPDTAVCGEFVISGNSRACFCYVSRRLLQCSLYRGAEDDYRQAATSAQCCRPCGQ